MLHASFSFQELRVQLFREEVCQFFRDLVIGTMKTREEKNIIRHDMIHLMMQARKDASALENSDNDSKKKLGKKIIIAEK